MASAIVGCWSSALALSLRLRCYTCCCLRVGPLHLAYEWLALVLACFTCLSVSFCFVCVVLLQSLLGAP